MEEILHKKDLLKYLESGNKDELMKTLISQKRMHLKKKDCVTPMGCILLDDKGNAMKENVSLSELPDKLKVRVVINTTNIMDSHLDVHYPGIWKKSLSENSMIMHLQEHKQGFEYIISDQSDLKAYTKNYSWRQLGYDFKGTTEALVFDSTVKKLGQKPRCEFMYEQYSKGYVRNHSVGMYYMKIVTCINEPDNEYYGAEFEAWEKYFPEVINQDFALEKGFFWLVKEAKVVEGSAVPLGSNYATPTLDNNLKSRETTHETSRQMDTGKTVSELIKSFSID